MRQGDRFIPLCGVLLPAVNVGLFFGVRALGAAHGRGPVGVAIVLAAETVLIALYCAAATRRKLVWAVAGAGLNVAASVVLIYIVTFAILAIGYAGGRAGD